MSSYFPFFILLLRIKEMSVYFISGGLVLAHFLYKYNTQISNYIQTKIVDYRVTNLHEIIDSLEQRLVEKQTEMENLHKTNQELESRLSEMNTKVSEFIQTTYEFVDES